MFRQCYEWITSEQRCFRCIGEWRLPDGWYVKSNVRNASEKQLSVHITKNYGALGTDVMIRFDSPQQAYIKFEKTYEDHVSCSVNIKLNLSKDGNWEACCFRADGQAIDWQTAQNFAALVLLSMTQLLQIDKFPPANNEAAKMLLVVYKVLGTLILSRDASSYANWLRLHEEGVLRRVPIEVVALGCWHPRVGANSLFFRLPPDIRERILLDVSCENNPIVRILDCPSVQDVLNIMPLQFIMEMQLFIASPPSDMQHREEVISVLSQAMPFCMVHDPNCKDKVSAELRRTEATGKVLDLIHTCYKATESANLPQP